MGTARLFPAYQIPASQRESRAALVPAIRQAVHAWRGRGYEGATATTKRLLSHWFESDHLSKDGEEWLYYYCQREAIETLIYLYEVVRARSLYDLAKHFDTQRRVSVNPSQDRWARYVCKMATGSGKTKVHVARHDRGVRQRPFRRPAGATTTPRRSRSSRPTSSSTSGCLMDFRGGAIVRAVCLIPPGWESDWQFTVVNRDVPIVSWTPGTFYLTNIHQLYGSQGSAGGGQEPEEMTAVIGGPRPGALEGTGVGLRERMLSHGELMVLNDEGHHLHTDELKWAKVIQRMDAELRSRTGAGLRAQFDFTATPKHNNGALFNEIVVDYPLAQAVEDGIVKRAILGEPLGA